MDGPPRAWGWGRGAGSRWAANALAPVPAALRPPAAAPAGQLQTDPAGAEQDAEECGCTHDVGPRGGGTETHETIGALSGPHETSFPRLAAESCSPERRVGAGTDSGWHGAGPASPPTTGPPRARVMGAPPGPALIPPTRSRPLPCRSLVPPDLGERDGLTGK